LPSKATAGLKGVSKSLALKKDSFDEMKKAYGENLKELGKST